MPVNWLLETHMEKQNSKWLSVFILSSAAFLSVIDIFIVNVAVPSIKEGINGSDGDIQLVIALYLLGYAAFLVTGGRIGDYYGKKKVFVISMVLFTAASCLCGISQTPFQLNSARLFQGIAAAFMVPQSISYIQILFPEKQERIKALGIYGTIAGTASVIGQFLGGVLPDTHFFMEGWRLIFMINLPLGLVSAVFAQRYLKEAVIVKSGKFDYSGVFLLTLTLVFLIYPMIRGRELNWPLWSVLMILAGMVLLFVFIKDQRKKLSRAKEPLINMELFTFKDFNLGLCAVFFYFMVQDSYFLINAILFQTGLGISSSETGVYFVFQGVGYVIASLIAVRLIPFYGKRVLQAGVLVMIVALVFHVFLFSNGLPDRWLILPVLFFYGIGCGSVLPSLLTVTIKGVPAKFAGAAAGTYATFQQTAIALGICVVGGLFFYQLDGQPSLNGAAYIGAYRLATFINIGLLLLVCMFLQFLPERSAE